GGIRIRETVLSEDGGFLAYLFDPRGLAPGAHALRKGYRHQRAPRVTVASSAGADGTLADSFSRNIAISGDGRVVAFSSFALNLDPDTFDVQNVFARTETGPPSLNAADADSADTVLQVFDPAAQPPALRPAARVPAEAVAVAGG